MANLCGRALGGGCGATTLKSCSTSTPSHEDWQTIREQTYDPGNQQRRFDPDDSLSGVWQVYDVVEMSYVVFEPDRKHSDRQKRDHHCANREAEGATPPREEQRGTDDRHHHQ